MNLFKVYGYVLCPFSRKIRILLKDKGIDFKLVNEQFWLRRKNFIKLTPTCETPVLVVNDEVIIWGNQSITEYIEEYTASIKKAKNDKIESNIFHKAQIRKITEWFDIKFYQEVTKHIFNEKILKTVAHQGYPNSQAIQIAKTNIIYHLEFITYLLKSNIYLASEYVSTADFAAAAQLSVLDYVGDVPWNSYNSVKEWYALIKSRPSFKDILADRIPNFAPPLHYQNPDF